MTQKICPVCESKFDFEDPNYKFCPYCGIILIRSYPHGKKPIYNPSKRDANIMEKMKELEPTPWGDENPIMKELKELHKALHAKRVMRERVQKKERKYHGN